MSWLSNMFSGHRNDDSEELPIVIVEDDEGYETPEERHAREYPGICPGCGNPVDDHPLTVNLACNDWWR